MTSLRELAAPRPRAAPPAAEETCDLCAAALAEEHRHLVDLAEQRLLCACRACTVLFDRGAAGGGHYRLVPDRRRVVNGFRLPEERWAGFGIPVSLAFFFRSSRVGRVVCFYPSPAGATESLLDLAAWDELEADNPVLATLEPDVEALLLDRTEEGGETAFLVPIDECYALVGVMRSHWRGLNGGAEVWQQVGRFFERLRARAEPVSPDA
jgi:Family of unknown function (DUF5947)